MTENLAIFGTWALGIGGLVLAGLALVALTLLATGVLWLFVTEEGQEHLSGFVFIIALIAGVVGSLWLVTAGAFVFGQRILEHFAS